MNSLLADNIRSCANLPSMPAIALEVFALAQHPDADISRIAVTISKDPALSSKILRTVNSSFYGRAQPVSTISQGLIVLGLQSVKTLVLGFSLVTNLSTCGVAGFKHLHYWKRSIYAATAARTIASKLKIVQQEEVFLAALLMDVGMLVLDQVAGEAYGAICQNADSHEELLALEKAALGMTHADAGAILADRWNLPPLLATPIGRHHDPASVEDPQLRKLTEAVQLAGRCADVFVDQEAAGSIAAVRDLCRNHHDFTDADADVLLAEIGQRTKESASLFDINIGTPAAYETILRKANEALVEMTLQSQAQASALQQRAMTLVQQNEALRHRAETDPLTGLANRARFDQFLAEQMHVAVESGKPLSLLLMDLDHFKNVNDTHGHQAGDTVLMALGRLLATAARTQDLAARYGGEEMVLVLPGTAKATAAATAESIRRAICARPIATGAGALSVSASVGVATYEPDSPLKTPAHLIKAADMALYAAKHAGRNCVRVFTMSKAA